MLKHEPTPALSQDNEVWVSIPEISAQLDKEGIGLLFHGIRVPVAMVLITDHDLSVEEIFI